MICILDQQDKVPISIQSKKYISVPFLVLVNVPETSWVTTVVYWFIGIEIDSNSNTQWSQRHYLLKTAIKKVSTSKSFVRLNLVGYKSHDTNSIPKQFIKTTHVINITTTRLFFIRLCFRVHAVSSRLLLGPWHSNDAPSSLQSSTISYGDCRVCMYPVVRMRRIVLAIVLVCIKQNCWRETLLLT